MKKLGLLVSTALLLVFVSGCEAPVTYGGAYGGVYGEYPATGYGYYSSPAPAYSYYPYGYRRTWAPYDRDHYWDRGRHWEGRGYREERSGHREERREHDHD